MDLKERPEQLISIKSTKGDRMVMSVKDIVYIKRESYSKNCIVRFISSRGDDSLITRMLLGDFEEVLPNQFVKINRTTLVNMRHVYGYNSEYCVVTLFAQNRQRLPLTLPIGHKFIEL